MEIDVGLTRHWDELGTAGSLNVRRAYLRFSRAVRDGFSVWAIGGRG
jgi:hypothetical protein